MASPSGMSASLQRWLIVHVQEEDGVLRLRTVEEDTGPDIVRGISLPPQMRWGAGSTVRVVAAQAFNDEVLARTRWELTTLYLNIALGLERLAIEEIVEQFFTSQGASEDRLLIVRLARQAADWSRGRRFELPLRVAGLGHYADSVASAARMSHWTKTVLGEGLSVGLPGVSEGNLDILVSGLSDMAHVRSLLEGDEKLAATRLLVAFDDVGAGSSVPDISDVPMGPGRSLLVLPGSRKNQRSYLSSILEEFTHDLSLDRLAEKLHSERWPIRPILVSDPEAVEAMRMGDAVSSVVDEANRIRRGLSRGIPNDFAGGRYWVQQASAMDPDADARLTTILGTKISFSGEEHGLLPLTKVRRELAEARSVADHTANLLAHSTPEDVAALEARQVRVVDLQVQRLEFPDALSLFLKPYERLSADKSYRLLVHIGKRGANSIVVGSSPPADTGLPVIEEGKHHLFHVAFYSNDFDLSGDMMKALKLPRIGDSLPVEFIIRPKSGRSVAEARILLYYDSAPGEESSLETAYRNHLVQSFLLSARIDPFPVGSTGADVPAIQAKFDMSQTAHFANVAALQPRILSLTLNDSGEGSTHRLMLKRGGHAGAVQFTEKQMEGALAEARSVLEGLSWNKAGTGPRFDGTVDTAAQTLSPEFRAALADLVRVGSELRRLLWVDAATELKADLRMVRETANQTIQVTRLNQSYHFPWTLIYDFRTPKADAAICEGFLRLHEDGRPFSCTDCLRDCQHPDKATAYCVFGFWGTRHQIEQLVGGVTARDSILTLRPLRNGAVHLTVGLDDGMLATLPTKLRTALARRAGDWLTIAEANEDLLVILRSDETRPAILLVASHYVPEAVGNRSVPRIKLPGLNRWLRPSEIIDETADFDSWADPHPLVVLATCASGKADLCSFSDFISAFLDAGASGVVGTEAAISEGLAIRLALFFTPSILNGQKLGSLMLDFRRDLLRAGHPLGFLFTAYGSADLTAAPPDDVVEREVT